MTDQTMNGPAPMIPALRRMLEPLAPYGYAFIRICAGLIIARHGYPKLFEGGATGLGHGTILPALGFNPPLVWAWIIGCVEFVGGLCLAFGLLTRLAAAMLVVEFAVIVFAVKWDNGLFAFAPKAIQPGFAGLVPGGFEFEMLLGLICLAAVFRGGDRVSIDRAIGKEL
jgi:putative oxidoreductase